MLNPLENTTSQLSQMTLHTLLSLGLDLETTGLSYLEDPIIEIAAVP